MNDHAYEAGIAYLISKPIDFAHPTRVLAIRPSFDSMGA
jgi:hypothetical protein